MLGIDSVLAMGMMTISKFKIKVEGGGNAQALSSIASSSERLMGR